MEISSKLNQKKCKKITFLVLNLYITKIIEISTLNFVKILQKRVKKMYKKIKKFWKILKLKQGNLLVIHKIYIKFSKYFKKLQFFCPKFDNFCKINILEISSKLHDFFKIILFKKSHKNFKNKTENFSEQKTGIMLENL